MSEQLIRRRGSAKASLTSFSKFIELKKAEQALGDTDVIQLRDRLSRIEIMYDEFNGIQTEIEAIVENAKLDEQYTERSNFDESYFKAVAIAKSLLAKYESKNDDDMSVHSNMSANSVAAGVANIQGVKLPVISLPKFQGSYEDWLEFRETFESLVHNNETLTPIQRYHYLRASLGGSAALVIKSVEFTAAGYTVAWQALCDRYNNTKLLVHNHIKSIFALDNIPKESSSKIRKISDDLSKHLRSIEQLKQNTENWDPLLIFIIASKLDSKTLGEWEKHSVDIETPALDDFKTFLRNRADLLETLEYRNNTNLSRDDKQYKRENKQGSRSLVSFTISCYYCKKDHAIYSCDDFKGLAVDKRVEFVKRAKLCSNCLRDNHVTKKCKMGPCMKCKSWHNTLLHQEGSENTKQESVTRKSEQDTTALSSGVERLGPRQVLLSTARVKVSDRAGKPHLVRVLLDSGSQSSFITSRLCDQLGLEKTNTCLNVFGISNAVSKVRKKCEVKMSSLYSNFVANITCFILTEITNISTGFDIDMSVLDIPLDLNLADPEFDKPGPIDLLIGAELFWILLKSNKKTCGKNNPVFQETELGWIVSGQVGGACALRSKNVTCNLSSNQELYDILTKFWEIEECNSTKPLSEDERECERVFSETTRRDQSGRFIVTLPLRRSADCLGESHAQAEKMFYNTERRLQKNEPLRELYVNFMQEYEVLGHMSPVVGEIKASKSEYYMPHHGVLRTGSLTTKLRVVFNASFPTNNGLSLNDIQRVGPVLQDDLLSIILRFRQHRYVMSADCSKMYRQVMLEPKQRSLQKILWRSDQTEKLKSYVLNTVTYGHASASFLAIRCLFELANECEEDKPDIASIIRHDFYVDDMLTGAETIEHAQYICRQVSQVLNGGCFELRKWCSNDPRVLKDVQNSGLSCGILEFGPGDSTKTLGLNWSCQSDKLLYSIESITNNEKCTKRSVLSLIAKIFDPLGLLGPVIVIAKILMQSLWSCKLSWDDALPESLVSRWDQFTSELPRLNELTVNRHVICEGATNIELHGYADASERAYGANLYVRSVDAQGNIHVHLLCAKTKVAPIKTSSIPRLELCAALLLAQLAEKAIKSLTLKFERCVFWSDSAIALAWIRTSPNLLKTFIANRVAEIQSLTKDCEWRHVPSHDNPADYLSRGLYPSQIMISSSWWHGPYWLKLDPSEWPSFEYKVDSLPEMKSQSNVALLVNAGNTFPFEKFSRFSRLLRVTAYVIRFKDNCAKPQLNREKGPLTKCELSEALKCLVRAAQRQSFPEVVVKLQEKHILNPKDKITSLAPYLDQDDIIRVGGRLELSGFSSDKRHPILLHSNHPFTKLLFVHEHIRLMHVGPQALLGSIREEYWPIAGRNLARATTRKCIRCFRFRPDYVQPMMGNLPRDRTVPSPPFHVTGVDYAGPFLTRRTHSKGRNCKLEKCYVGLFVCFSTKALHLELVSSLSTESFLQALRRFVSRRGKPAKIYSDNGSNFIGAARELKSFFDSSKDNFLSIIASQGIEWQFIPPYSPHMGGLWEAGVKSVKYHLKRVLSNAHLTFEEFATTLSQIEAILNSRPLCSLTTDPNDLSPLTPAHFLIGRPLVAAPDENLSDVKIGRLTRFQLVQRLSQHFWKRWQREYITELQVRQKWKSNRGQLCKDMLVLIKSDQTLPTDWQLGRIVELHSGADGISRVASIRTRSGIVKRSFQRICPLPLYD